MVLSSVESIQGHREYMEDQHSYLEEDGIIVAMVCDGHGGTDVSLQTSTVLSRRILKTLHKTVGTNVTNALAIRNEILNWGDTVRPWHSGTTLTGIAIKEGIVYVYNVGDSRTCAELRHGSFIYMLQPIFNQRGKFVDKIMIDYYQNNFFCTIDHDCESPFEVSRIKSAGGTVRDQRLNGILSLSRALGDGDIGLGLSSVPDIYWFKEDAVTGPILMFSDGLYEPQRYPETKANFSDTHLYEIAKRDGVKEVVNYAFENGSEDNLTALKVTL